MGGLAGRWIGAHALAFLIGRRVLDAYWFAEVAIHEGWMFQNGVAWTVMSAAFPGIAATAAQALVLRGRSFPTPPERWLWTSVTGALLAGVAMWNLSHPAGRAIHRLPLGYESEQALLRAFQLVTVGAILAMVQGWVLNRRTGARDAGIWMASVVAACLTAGAVTFLRSLQEHRLVEAPLESNGSITLTRAVIAAGQGALYGAILYPALRRLLVLRGEPSAA